MSPKSKKEYLSIIAPRFKKSSRKQKSAILDEFCNVYRCHRKHAIRILYKHKRFIKPKYHKRGRKPIYDKNALIPILKKIWLDSYQPCSKLLKAAIPIWLPSYIQSFGDIPQHIVEQMLAISPSTIDRFLASTRSKLSKHGRSTTKPGSLLKNQIPIKTNQWDESKPGFLEADTVAHCGDSTQGQYALTINLVDIATTWSEQRAVWGKGESGVLEQIQDAETYFPFQILGFDSDNGSEFINWHLFRHFTEKKQPVQFTRSRPYQKNDNAHVEQKNWTHVRQWLGYDRFENPDIPTLLNKLYKNEWRLFHNFFCPSVKLIKKQRVNSKIIKLHDKPKTPFQRVFESTYISNETKSTLKEQFDTLNPFELRKCIEKKLKKIFQQSLLKSEL
ncbi:integrase [bacterium]